ncbi:MAG: 3-hydroxyacyl-ACP dehydratase FabZ [Armatimonadetes bacterium]|nr:3-hydroxyacyl-ACP dehydratase FabZ [Armatimonadota bacterium]
METKVESLPETTLDIKGIQRILPHRYPFLLVDRILELENKKRAIGVKNVSFNEPFFMGHFPDQPVMPGVLIVEALAQVGGIMMLSNLEYSEKTPFLAGIENFKFRRPVVPGDQLLMEVELCHSKGTFGKLRAIARVNGNLVAEGTIIFALVDRISP